ncbi:MAG: dipeptide epimerase [Planctomycetota bacterium]|nr:dipeptide epimerase [Planctomycetota bacterium]
MTVDRVEMRLHQFQLPLRHAFGISRFTHSVQPSLIVELIDGVHSGYGESTTDPYYQTSLESMAAAAESAREVVEQTGWEHPRVLWEALEQPLLGESFVRCAIDQAAYDLWGKRRGYPTHKLLELDVSQCPSSSYTIGLDDIAVMVSKIREEPDWPIYKIKLGTDHDLQIIEELRKHSEAVFRVDANCAWTARQAIEHSHQLRDLGVEFIEQPLRADDWEGARSVYQESALPIIADEACLIASDIAKCANHFHGVNIKMIKCGGITPALDMISHARDLGLKVMLGCMTESTVGISAIAQLLPLLDFADIDGANLLAEDIASGVKVERGRCRFPRHSGNGVTDFRSDFSSER